MAHLTKAQKAKAATRVLPEEDPEFQIAPMIDILLVLLVFFMSIATDQVLQVNKEVVLPVAKVEKEAEKPISLSEVMVNVIWTLDNMGKIEVDGRPDTELANLTDYINKKRQAAEDSGVANFRVVIRADKRAKYQYIRGVMASIGAAKVPNVIFSAVDKEMERPK
jgi:biopolymer transport protein ExbD